MRLRSAVAVAAAVCGLAAVGPADARPSPVDGILARCPTPQEVAAIDADLAITFDADSTAGQLDCTAAAGSVDLTPLQRYVYGALRAMRAMTFDRPLPWTPASLYDWFVGAVEGIRVLPAGSIPGGLGFCCDPPGVIDIVPPAPRGLAIHRWQDRENSGNFGTLILVSTLVHEARHAEGPVHECGQRDNTITELGAWGVEVNFNLWLALYSGSFLTSPDTPSPAYYRDTAFYQAWAGRHLVCHSPAANLSVKVKDGPDPVHTGGTLTYTITVVNHGPDPASNVYLYSDSPLGARVTRIGSDRGSCSTVADTRRAGAVGCSLGSLAAGASTVVTVVYVVTAGPGQTLTNGLPHRRAGSGTRVLSSDQDSHADGDRTYVVTRVVAG